MAVVCENQFGWVVDHKLAIDRIYMENAYRKVKDAGVPSQHCGKIGFKGQLFDIQYPFVMDSQYFATKNKSSLDDLNKKDQNRKKRKRKRKSELNIGEIKALNYHSAVKDKLQAAYGSLTELAKEHGYFHARGDMCDGDNNLRARTLARELDDDDLQELCNRADASLMKRRTTEQSLSVNNIGDTAMDCEIVNRLVTNSSEQARIMTVSGSQYIVPPKSSFVLSDFTQFHSCQGLGEFDVIVIDPPWQNKSAKRKKRYHTMCNDDLLELSFPDIAADGCLVAVWVTNRWQHIEFIKEQLFPKWSVQFEAEWHWIKVTKSGQMVYDFDSDHKKPYEIIILGQFIRSNESCTTNKSPHHIIQNESCSAIQTSAKKQIHHSSSHSDSPDSVTKDKDNVSQCEVTGGETTRNNRLKEPLPHHRVIVSIPCSVHSMKPPLSEILKPYICTNARCLELFARNLWPGWTSWGNQVIKHQHLKYFDSLT